MAIENGLAITQEHVDPALMILRENLAAARLLEPQYNSAWGTGSKGDTVPIRVPSKFVSSEHVDGTPRTFQTISETETDLRLNFHTQIPVRLSERQAAYGIDDINMRITVPAVNQLCRDVDRNIIGTVGRQLRHIYAKSRTSVAAPNSISDMTQMEKVLVDNLVPDMGRIAITNSAVRASLLSIPTFVEADKRGDGGSALENANVGQLFGIQFNMDQNVQQTSATSSTGWLANGAALVNSTTMAIDGGTNTPVVGDIFTVEGTDHVVTATFAGAAGSITFAPGLTAGVADNAPLTFLPKHAMNFVGHRRAVGLAFVPLSMNVAGASAMTSTDPDTGLSIRMVSQYDIDDGRHKLVYDILYGVKVVQPELALRLVTP